MAKVLTAEDLKLDDDAEERNLTNDSLEGPNKQETVDSPKNEEKEEEEEGEIGKEVLEHKEAKEKEKREEEERFEYKSQKEAEKAVKEAKKMMHEATTKASKLEKIITDLEKRLNVASKTSPTSPDENPFEKKRQQVADDTLTEVAKIQYPKSPSTDDFDSDEAYQKAVEAYNKAINEYNIKVARIWANAQAEIAKITVEERENYQSDIKKVNDSIDKILKAEDLYGIEGINDLFWSQASNVSKSLSIEDQIKETVKRCKKIIDGIRAKERERAKKDREEKENLDILGRGSRIITKTEESPPTTMREAQKAALERRRLRVTP